MNEDFAGTINVGFEVGVNWDGAINVTPPALEVIGFIDVAEPHDIAFGFITVQD